MKMEEMILLNDVTLGDKELKEGDSVTVIGKESGDLVLCHHSGWYPVDGSYFKSSFLT